MESKKNIALVSTNKDKYSETFIRNHLKYLEGNIFYLFDGYLPCKYSNDRGKTYNSILENDNAILQSESIDNDNNQRSNLITALNSFILKNNIHLIFCEYGPSGVEMIQIAEHCKVPLIVHFHGYDAFRNDILNSYGKSYRDLFVYASAVIAVSLQMKLQLKELACPENKLFLRPYGIDTNIFSSVKTYIKTYDFVYCGRFVAKKGPLQTIKAFRILLQQFPEAKMCMIGDGELLEECKKFVQDANMLYSVVFKGVLKPKEVAEIFHSSRYFVLHSNTTIENDREGTPISIMEAGACGLAVISTNHAGIAEVIETGVDGYLVKENDIEEMTNRMIELFTNSALAELFGKRLQQKIRTGYRLEDNITALNKIIENCINDTQMN